MFRLVFVRHAESFKSAHDRHGGDGEPLTQRGRQQAEELGRWLASWLGHRDDVKVFSSSIVQVAETATILMQTTGLRVSVDERLKNIGLGVLSGLSKSEALNKYPEAAKMLESWREGKLPIEAVIIPDAETMGQFYDRVMSFLRPLLDDGPSTAIVVGTRSIGIMLANLITSGCSRYDPLNYRRYLFDPCSVSSFKVSHGAVDIEFLNKSDFLQTPLLYPDS